MPKSDDPPEPPRRKLVIPDLDTDGAVAYWKQEGGRMRKVCEIPEGLAGEVESYLLEMGAPLHGNAMPVRVLEVEHSELKKWLRAGRQPVSPGHLFTSAKEASNYLNFKYNLVGTLLSRERKQLEAEARQALGKKTHEDPGRVHPQIWLRGLLLQYEIDTTG